MRSDEEGHCDECAEKVRQQMKEDKEQELIKKDPPVNPYENYIEPTDEERLAGMV